MSRLLAFLAGAALGLTFPAAAQQVEIVCRPVVKPVVDCTPRYNRLSMECRRT